MAKTGAAAKAGGGFLKKMLGDMIRPAAKRAGKAADNVAAGAGDKASKEAQEKLAKEMAEQANKKVSKEIDDTLAKANPKFDASKSAYSENCTSVTQVNELRRRGVDAEAGPLEKHLWSSEGGPGGRGPNSIEDTWGRKFTAGSKDDITKAFEQAGPGSRGIVGIYWNKGGGHVFNVENVGGQVRYIDAQPNPGVTDAAGYFNKGHGTQYVRLDDLPTPDPSKLKRFTE
jgi:hypothetical protein